MFIIFSIIKSIANIFKPLFFIYFKQHFLQIIFLSHLFLYICYIFFIYFSYL